MTWGSGGLGLEEEFLIFGAGRCGRYRPRYSWRMDRVAKSRRSEIMSSIRSEEILGRRRRFGRWSTAWGIDFDFIVKTLPGKPDIVLSRHKKIILVHGCFWHGHARCLKGRPPKSNLEFWVPKLAANQGAGPSHRYETASPRLESLGDLAVSVAPD